MKETMTIHSGDKSQETVSVFLDSIL